MKKKKLKKITGKKNISKIFRNITNLVRIIQICKYNYKVVHKLKKKGYQISEIIG
jgi:tRNA G26 N,N-dimethylase Trm1